MARIAIARTHVVTRVTHVGTMVAHYCYGACQKQQGYEADSNNRDIQDNLGKADAPLELHSAHHCQHCVSSQRQQSKKPTVSAYFLAALAHLISTRLNARAAPFLGTTIVRTMPARVLSTRLNPRSSMFIPRVRRNRLHYLVEPETKHLRLPVKDSTKRDQKTSKSIATVKPTRIETTMIKTKSSAKTI